MRPEEIYTEGYFRGEEYRDYVSDRKSLEVNFRKRLEAIREVCPAGTLVEIGCAYGFFLKVAAPWYKAIGFDVAERAVGYAREALGVDARREDFLQAGIREGSVEVVVMWDVMEHLRRPDAYLRRAHAVLRPGGILALTTGDAGSLVARVRRSQWRLVHPPTHLHYFSRQGLCGLLARTGFRVGRVRYPAIHRSLRQIVHGLLVLGRPERKVWAEQLERWTWLDRTIPLNLFDVVEVLAVRP